MSPPSLRRLSAVAYSSAGGSGCSLVTSSVRTRRAAHFRSAASQTSRESRPEAPSDCAAKAAWSEGLRCFAYRARIARRVASSSGVRLTIALGVRVSVVAACVSG